MPPLANDLVSAVPACVNQRLLGSALAGLLCLATAGCSGKQATPDTSATSGAAAMPGAAGTTAAASGGSTSTGAAAGTSAGGVASSTGGVAVGVGGGGADALGGTAPSTGGVSDLAGTGGTADVAGSGGAAAEVPHITSSKDVGMLSADDFKALCDERAGTVEVMPHCGGFATAKGVSYDSGTELLSEHTCMGANTCGGWNCVID